MITGYVIHAHPLTPTHTRSLARTPAPAPLTSAH